MPLILPLYFDRNFTPKVTDESLWKGVPGTAEADHIEAADEPGDTIVVGSVA